MKFSRKIKSILNYFTAFKYPKNWLLCHKYPFLKVRNVWDGCFCGYSFTEADVIRGAGEGWWNAFGDQLLKDFKDALITDRVLYIIKTKGNYREPKLFKYIRGRHFYKKACQGVLFYDVKEKWGYLVLSATCGGKAQEVLRKYENISADYCQYCGKPSEYETPGWITFVCSNCFDQISSGRGKDLRGKDYLKYKEECKIKGEKKEG